MQSDRATHIRAQQASARRRKARRVKREQQARRNLITTLMLYAMSIGLVGLVLLYH